MSDLQAYLAAKYMTGAKADAILDRAGEDAPKRRKKKRKVDGGSVVVAEGGGMIIADDDGMGWARQKEKDEEEDGRPVVEERRGHFKAKNANSWETIRPPSPTYVRTPSPEPVDEDPYVVSTTVDLTPSVPPPAPARGGLQSASALRAEQERRAIEQEAKKAQAARELAIRKQELRDRGEDDDELEDPTATVYRDASGKKIDMKLAKAEKAKMERDRVEKEMQKMEWGKGLVQKGEKEERKKEAERLAQKGIARYADDEDMNDELKDQERWNDPAAAFLTKKKKVKTAGPRFPKYSGPSPAPNRFGIPPGYRWDGVDRGNGFEAKKMQSGNARKARAAEAHAFSTEDM